jgi:hypothetical protein
MMLEFQEWVRGLKMRRPICVKCKVEMHPEQNGVQVEFLVEGRSLELYEGDKWKCRECGIEVISGFGIQPVAEHWHENYARTVKALGPTIKVNV